jgi:hypothetical protein
MQHFKIMPLFLKAVERLLARSEAALRLEQRKSPAARNRRAQYHKLARLCRNSKPLSRVSRKARMFDEDVQVRMGLDRRPFDKALSGAKGSLSAFKGALGAIGAAFSLGAIKSFAGSILDMADGLTRQSEALKVSTDFLQDWQFAAGQTGSSADEAQKALDKFANKLAESGKAGADVEQEIRKLADAIAKQPDPLRRASMASDAFGDKLGVKLIPLLAGGSKALDEFAKSANKLSPDQIRNIDEFGDRLGEAGRNLQIRGGKILGGFFKLVEEAGAASAKFNWKTDSLLDFVSAMGEASVEIDMAAAASDADEKAKQRAAQAAANLAEKQALVTKAYKEAGHAQAEADFESATAAEQLNILLGFRKKLISELGPKPAQTVDNAKRLAALAKLGVDIAKQQKDMDADRLKVLDKQTQAMEAQNRVAGARGDLAAARQDRSGLTLQELANATPFTRTGAANVQAARQVINAEDFAQRARIEGRTDLAERATNFALELRKKIDPLTTSEKNPLANMETNIEGAREAMEALLEKASRDGLVVQPRNGQ